MRIGARSTAARIGVVLLNILVPGLGLLRIGAWGAALLIALLPVAWLLLVLGIAVVAAGVNYAVLMTLVALALLMTAGTYIGSIVLTWRRSRLRAPLRWWSRWYGLIGFVLAYQLLAWPVTSLIHWHYKPFYIPSEAMLPTLQVDDRILATMGQPDSIARGEIVLVRTDGGHIYIKRVAALGGDRIALDDGVVILNGRRVSQRLTGHDRITESGRSVSVAKVEERFPGEEGSHFIYDLGISEADQFDEVRVMPGHIFLLGDYRDRSADSRIAKPLGLEQVPVERVVGRAVLVTWSSDPARRGVRLD